MKKLMLAFLAVMMILGSLRAFAEGSSEGQTTGESKSQSGDAALLLVLGTLKAMAETQPSMKFDIYTHKDDKQEFKIVLLPISLARQIGVIDRSNASDSEKVAQVAQLFADLASDTSADSFCEVSGRVYSEKIENKEEKAKEAANIVSRCHSKLTKERIVRKADKLFTKEEIQNFELPADTTEFARYRIAYSFGAFLLQL